MSGDAHPFYEAGPDAILLDDLTLTGRPSVLERLGPALFRSKGFSFIGFLQTLYDHVAEQSNTACGTVAVESPAEAEAIAPTDPIAEPPTELVEEARSASPFDQPLGI